MPDISMCDNSKCKLSDTCYRFKAEPNPYRQTYADFQPKEVNGVTKCNSYYPMPNEEKITTPLLRV